MKTKELKVQELKDINGGKTGDAAYAIGYWGTRRLLSLATGGASEIYLNIKFLVENL